MELIRGDLSSNLGASLANALLLDLDAADLLKHPVSSILLDKSKIDREKARVKNKNVQTPQEFLKLVISET